MAKQVESLVSKRIVDGLNARGHFVWKNHGSVFSLRGLADITGFKRGSAVGIFLEVKRNTEKYGLSYQQYLRIISLRSKCPDALCGVVDGIDEAIQIVEGDTIQTSEWWRCITDLPEGRR